MSPHRITCQGRDHVVNVQHGRQSLVIANVHFEAELTLRRLRERLQLGNQKKEGLTYGTKHSPMVTRERTAIFHSFFHMFLRLLNLITLEGTPQPLGSYALYQGLIPSDHAAVRLVIHKPTNRERQSKRIRFSADPFGALAEFKAILEKAEKQNDP